jgi:hypothetical protein
MSLLNVDRGTSLCCLTTKIYRIPSAKSGNIDRSTTYGPTSSLSIIHLAPVPNTVVDNDEHRRHAEKPISPI